MTDESGDRDRLQKRGVVEREVLHQVVMMRQVFAVVFCDMMGISLVRQAKLVASFRVKVPNGREPRTGFRKV